MNDFLKRLHGTPPIPPEDRAGAIHPVSGIPRGVPPPRIDSREIDIVKRGEAIASVRALEDRVDVLTKANMNLERNFERCQDRCTMLDNEMQMWREQAQEFKTMLIELSSDMNAVALLHQRAQDTHERILAVIKNETHSPERNQTTHPVDRATQAIHSALEQTTSFADSSVEALQPGTSDEPGERGVPPAT